jgi:cardiolipin synthase
VSLAIGLLDLAYILGARIWMIRHGALRWRDIERVWQSGVAEARPEAVRAELSGTLHASDELKLLTDSGQAFFERQSLYNGAVASIDISTYYIQSDATGWSLARMLAECARRGVRVRLLLDRDMTDRKRLETEGLDALLAHLRDAGVEVRQWHDSTRRFDRNHRKVLLVDGSACIVGGRNFADHYRLGEWRDLDLLMRGPSVVELASVFDHAWHTVSLRTSPPWFDYTPEHITDDPTVRFVLACIESAESTIDAELAYLVGPAWLSNALVRAAGRGVRVRVLTNSAQSNDLPYTTYAAYLAMRQLIEGGVEVLVRRGSGRTLHSKYVVVDSEWVSFGSHNLDYYSSRFCCETNLHVRSERLAHLLEACFSEGMADSSRVDFHCEVLPFLRRAHAVRFFNWACRDFQ